MQFQAHRSISPRQHQIRVGDELQSQINPYQTETELGSAAETEKEGARATERASETHHTKASSYSHRTHENLLGFPRGAFHWSENHCWKGNFPALDRQLPVVAEIAVCLYSTFNFVHLFFLFFFFFIFLVRELLLFSLIIE